MSKQLNTIKLYVPKWVSVLFTLAAVLLVPWIIYLSGSLPVRHIEKHWDVAWVGLDMAIMILLLLTGFLASIKSRLVLLSLITTSSFLLVDAWFDVVTSRAGAEFYQAIILALVLEIPLAIIGYVLAYKTINKNFR